MDNKLESVPNSSVNVASFENEDVNLLFLPKIIETYDSLKALLPHLPKTINITFGTNYPYGDDGVTGSALSKDSMKIGTRIDHEDRTGQISRIKSVIFHEGYHIGQGFYNSDPCSAIEAAIYEGCATIFEREYANSNPEWGDYSMHSEETLLAWLKEMKTITADQYFEPSGETWRKWAFYDPETNESWRVYRVGTWIVENVIRKTKLEVIELNSMSAIEILGRFE
jgi:hypothetical protein